MLEPLLGTINREWVLQYILVFEEGYAREIARFFDVPLPSIQNQLEKLEQGGVFLSKMSGKTRRYFFNPRYAFLGELTALLEKARQFYEPQMQAKFTLQRMRPRRPEKPL
ncbi:MAG: DNA-binding protein [Sulfuricurvum sp. PC08-66]|nr:MAG: DNA-binding protein [Sulfuricurvum sp. PC08-66]